MPELTTLPDYDELMRRLAAVDNSPWNVQKLYPLIARAGGSERAGAGLPMLFELAIADVCDGAVQHVTTRMLVPAWLEAIVDDGDVLADALAAFEQADATLKAGA